MYSVILHEGHGESGVVLVLANFQASVIALIKIYDNFFEGEN